MPEKSKAKILLVDDSRIIQSVGSKILTGKGFTVTLASDGQEALKLFSNHRFDLIILDYHKEAIRKMKRWENQYSEKSLQKFEELTHQRELKHDSL